MVPTEAIILRTVDFSESSLVLTLYSRDFGKISALAKGGRRLKGPFESSLDLLARVRTVVLRKTSGALDLLTESKLLWRFRPDSDNLAGLYAGYVLAELINELTEEGEPNVPLYDLAAATLSDFASGSFVMRTLIRFEWCLLELLGLQPSLDRCVECGEKIDRERQKRITFGHLDGGVLCGNCREGHRQLASVSVEAIRMLERLIRHSASVEADFRERAWTRLPLEKSVLGEIRGLTNHYISQLLGKQPKMHDYLTEIARLDHE